jgi:hypothetical protein
VKKVATLDGLDSLLGWRAFFFGPVFSRRAAPRPRLAGAWGRMRRPLARAAPVWVQAVAPAGATQAWTLPWPGLALVVRPAQVA